MTNRELLFLMDTKGLKKMLCPIWCWAEAFSQVLAGVGVTGAAWETNALEMGRLVCISPPRALNVLGCLNGLASGPKVQLFGCCDSCGYPSHPGGSLCWASFSPRPCLHHLHVQKDKKWTFLIAGHLLHQYSLCSTVCGVWDTLDALQMAPLGALSAKRV